MEANGQDGRTFSERMWEDFTDEMDSSAFAAMQRIAWEADGMNVESMDAETEEITSGNEEEISSENEAVAAEAIYESGVFISEVTDEITGVNEEEISGVIEEITSDEEAISGVTDEITNDAEVISEVTEDITSDEAVISEVTDETINDEEVISEVTEDITSDEAGISEVTDETSIVIEPVIDKATSGNEEEASVCRGKIKSATRKKKPIIKMRGFMTVERYYFAKDLVRAVEKMQNDDEDSSPEGKRRKKIRPSPDNRPIYFSSIQEYFVQKFVSSNEEDFIALIKESIPTDYICVFETCKEQFIKRYTPQTFSEKTLLDFCAAIAFLGIYCSTRGLDPGGKSKATNFICSLLYIASPSLFENP